MAIEIKPTSIAWNWKLIKNLDKLVHEPAIAKFLKIETQKFHNQVIPKLPRNNKVRKNTNIPMSQALELDRIQKYPGGIKMGVGFNYSNQYHIDYFYVMLAGYRSSKKSNKKIWFKYSNPQTKNDILWKTWKIVRNGYYLRAKNVAEATIDLINQKYKDF